MCIYTTKKEDELQATYYTLENIIEYSNLSCPPPSYEYRNNKINNIYSSSYINTTGSIVIMNAPLKYDNIINRYMPILIPPNFKSLIKKCEENNKYMVVCDLTLLENFDTKKTSHANVLIFDTRRKTIERFDPHGGSEYKYVELVYDKKNKILGRQDFKFGNQKNNKIESTALFNQVYIDTKLKDKFKEIIPEYTYYSTNDTTPYLGPQVKTDEFDGLCVTWSLMYMILRLLNPDMSPPEITIKMIDGTPEELKRKVLRFQKFVIKTLQKEKKKILDMHIKLK